MFKLLSRRSTEANELLTSQLFDQTGFYSAFLSDLADATHEVIVESPFITHKRINALYPSFRALAKRGVHIVVNTKPPEEHDAEFAVQALEVISKLQYLGVKVLYTGGHHRKLAIIDRCVVWEGSLNILSQSDSCEIMRKITSPVLAEQLISFLKIEKHIRKGTL